MRPPFLVRLRPTLLTTIVGLVLLTALAIGGSAAILTMTITRTLIDQARTDAVTAAREETRQLFNDPARTVSALAAAAQRGAIPVGDRDRLAALLAEQLRVMPRLAFIGYGDAAGGWYVGAGRNDQGEIVEYIADPSVNGSVPAETVAAADGTRSTPKPSGMPPYFAVTRPWFKDGIAAPGPVWSSFYQFTTGVTGITCVSRFTAPGGKPTGVFHADLQVDGIAELLSSLRVGRRGAVFLVDSDGRAVVRPQTGIAQRSRRRSRGRGAAACGRDAGRARAPVSRRPVLRGHVRAGADCR